jgi:hypothetical protein
MAARRDRRPMLSNAFAAGSNGPGTTTSTHARCQEGARFGADTRPIADGITSSRHHHVGHRRGWFDMCDLGVMLDHKKPPAPHPATDPPAPIRARIRAGLNSASEKNDQDCHGSCLKTRCTTLVPTPSVLPILRMPSPLALNSSMRASTEGLTRRRPNFVPFALARARPAFTRSRMIPRSNSANTPSI